MSRKQNSLKTQDRPHVASITLSILALLVSGLSLWESHEARSVAYESSLPAINATVELVEPLSPGKQIQFRTTLDNLGKTPAKQTRTVLASNSRKAIYRLSPPFLSVGDSSDPRRIFCPEATLRCTRQTR